MAAELSKELCGNDGGELYLEAAKVIKDQAAQIDKASAMIDTAQPMLEVLQNIVGKVGASNAAQIKSLLERLKNFRKSDIQGGVSE